LNRTFGSGSERFSPGSREVQTWNRTYFIIIIIIIIYVLLKKYSKIWNVCKLSPMIKEIQCLREIDTCECEWVARNGWVGVEMGGLALENGRMGCLRSRRFSFVCLSLYTTYKNLNTIVNIKEIRNK
jgi:hypothetical protein